MRGRADRPNILLIMSDEHAATFSGTYGHHLVKTPNMDRLADKGTTFDQAYCNSPLCLPSRMSFMTGRYVHRIKAWDNATPLPSDTVTWAHTLRAAGYDAVLCGKQHFCGPDQLHGFRAQLARDLHAELWTKNGVLHGTPDWSKGIIDAKRPWAGLESAGPGHTEEIEVDDWVERAAIDYIHESPSRKRPWALNVSFIAPHFPLVAPDEYWEMYPPEDVDLPTIPSGHLEQQHPVYQRMRRMFGLDDFPEELVRRGRAGYYALITYLDAKIGSLLDALETSGQADNTLVVYFSDHGDMNGEHGMWRKSNFYDPSSRVPLQMVWPGRIPENRRVHQVVSLVDLVATFLDAAGEGDAVPIDGRSLLPCLEGRVPWHDEAFCEYLAHGVKGPMAMLRKGSYKLNHSLGDPPELYDMEADPGEFHNLAQDPDYGGITNELLQQLLNVWHPEELEMEVRQSQRERLLIEKSESG